MENLQGTVLKGYRLEERIGSGGFGAVYRAKQTTVGREVAVKIILPGFANNPDFIRRFEIEAQLVARLEHPHITPLHDYWRDPNGAYLVMRYLRGGSVRHSLQTQSYELFSISQLLDQIASALDFAHRHDVIHRDIKPDNILLDEDGNAYLADFGIAKDLTSVGENQTAVDAVVGSLDYISPEQARSESVTPRTDIYSLGVTLYEMITGEHPFKGASTVERLYKHINDPLPEIANLPDNLRDVINDIIQKATAKDPEKRYEDVFALALAFREGVGRNDSKADNNIIEQLTLREQEILSLVADGMSNQGIAEKLVVTVGTVKWHITQLYRKLGVRSRVQAIVRGRELNLIVGGNITAELNPALTGITSSALPEPENPYKGLYAFQASDSRDFFGRSELIDKLITRMTINETHHRFLAVVGPSGSGKSSLVKAGLIPAFWKGAIKGSEKWFVVDMIPGTHPIDKLEIALMRVAAQHMNNLRDQLQRDERGLLRIADLILPGDDTELVIVVDQFEEVFTLVEDEAMRQHFLNLLCAAVSDVRSRVRVVITLRADYYDRPLHYPEFGQLIRSRMETILPLSAKGLERAIRGPAERVKVTFEQGLVEQIVSQMNYQSGALPLLQYALTELFDRREGRVLTHKAYQDIGGAVGALANRADEIYRSLSPEAQELSHQMFMRMVTLGEGTEDTRRRATHSELLSLTNNSDLMEEIIDQYAAYRLLSLDHDPQTRQPTVEVAHEAILREWERLRQWLNESRTEIRLQQQLNHAANEWRNANQDVSFLMHGSRLDQFEAWAKQTSISLTPREQTFLQESLKQRGIQEDLERERIAREATQEKRSQNLLRALVAVFALATLVSGGLALFAIDRGNAALDAQQETLNALDVAQRSSVALAANDALDVREVDLAVALALESVGDNDTALLPETYRILERIEREGGPVVWNHVDGFENPPVFSRDRRYFAMSDGKNSFSIWDTTGYDEIARLTHIEPVKAILFSNDGSSLMTYSYQEDVFDGIDITVWDMQSWEILASYRLETAFASINYSYDPWLFATIDIAPENIQQAREYFYVSDTLSLRDILSGEIVRQFQFEGELIQFFDFMPNGTLGLVTGWSDASGLGNDYRAMIFDVTSGEILHTFDRTPNENYRSNISAQGGFNEDASQIYLSGHPNYIIDVATGEDYGQLSLLDNIPIDRPDPAFNFAMTNTFAGNPQLLNIATGEIVVFDTHFGYLAPQKNQIITRDLGRLDEFQVWDINGRISELAVLRSTSPTWLLTQMSYSPDGEKVVATRQGWGCERFATQGPTVYDANTFEVIAQFEDSQSQPWALEWSPDGRYIASGSFNQGVLLLDSVTGDEIRRFTGTLDCVAAIAFTPDSQYILAAHGVLTPAPTYDTNPYVVMWDVETGEEVRRFTIPTNAIPNDGIFELALHPAENLAYVSVAISLSDGFEGYFIDLDTGDIRVSPQPLNQAVFTVDGHLVGSLYATNRVYVLDPLTGETINQWIVLDADILGIDVSPDGKYVATGSGPLSFESIISIWDIETGQLMRRYQGHDIQSFIFSIQFSPDGTQIASSAFDATVRIWDFDSQSTLEWVRNNRVVRELNCTEREQYRVEPLCEQED